MLKSLRIQNLAVIEDVYLELKPGLNVLTGETGAGKSILVLALQLVMGAKVNAEIIRAGCPQAEVLAEFELPGENPLALDLVRQSPSMKRAPGAVRINVRRVLVAAGRARSFINDRAVSPTELKRLTRQLVDISSQHEFHTLTQPGTHLEHLDAFGRLQGKRQRASEAYRRWLEAQREFERCRDDSGTSQQRLHALQYEISAIQRVAPQPEEDEDLETECAKLQHVECLSNWTGSAAAELYERDGSLLERLAHVLRDVQRAAAIDGELRDLALQLEVLTAQVRDVALELSRYTNHLPNDPERLAQLEERRHAVNGLKRKYGGSLTEVLRRLDTAEQELAQLQACDWDLEALERRRDAARESALREADELSERRRAAATQLAEAIGLELQSLGMNDARIDVRLRRMDNALGEAKLSSTGLDRVEFLIAANPGEPARPLARVASGGELSRAMLALKRVLAGVDSTCLYVFDEVDTGVGGATAEVIGRKIHAISRQRQVFCITHLPQIAVFADQHFRVEKHARGGRTHSSVRRLLRDQRAEEVARMLAGLKVSQATRLAAKQMLRDARHQAA